MNKTYLCARCGAVFKFQTEPKFCPGCGCGEIRVHHKKAEETAKRTIEDCNKLIERIEPIWEEYVRLMAEYEDKMQVLRQYKKRGIISEESIPVMKKRTIASELKELRAKKRSS